MKIVKLNKFFVNFLFFTFSIYIPLFFFSAFEFLATYKSKYNIQKKEFYKSINEDAVKKIKALNSGYSPFITPNNLLSKTEKYNLYPIGSLPFSSIYYCDEGYGLIKYKTDRFGLRNDDKKWNDLLNKSNIFLIGDSFTHGACVSSENTISHNLEKEIGLNTLNLGSSENYPYEYMAVLQSFIKPIIKISNKYNKVVIIYYANDNLPFDFKKHKAIKNLKPIVKINKKNNLILTNDYKSKLTRVIKNEYPSNEKLIEHFENKRNKKFKPLFKESFLYQVGTLVPIRYRLKLLTQSALGKIYYKGTISSYLIFDLANFCNDLCKPYIVYIPNNTILRPDPRSSIYKNHLKNFALNNNVQFIDGEEVIDATGLDDYAPKGAHLSEKGYKKIAELIEKKIRN